MQFISLLDDDLDFPPISPSDPLVAAAGWIVSNDNNEQ